MGFRLRLLWEVARLEYARLVARLRTPQRKRAGPPEPVLDLRDRLRGRGQVRAKPSATATPVILHMPLASEPISALRRAQQRQGVYTSMVADGHADGRAPVVHEVEGTLTAYVQDADLYRRVCADALNTGDGLLEVDGRDLDVVCDPPVFYEPHKCFRLAYDGVPVEIVERKPNGVVVIRRRRRPG